MAAKKLGTLIKEARTKKGLTQAQLGSAVGMSAQEISRAERGEYEPSEAQLKAIAKATGVTQKSLLEAAKGTSAKPASSKPASSKPVSSKPAASPKLTADEKELLELYRKADEQTKESAKKLLEEGAEQTGGLLANLLGGGGGNILGSLLGGGSNNSNQNNSGGSGSLLGSLLGGGGGGGSFLSSLLGGVLGGKREMPEGADENAANEDGFIELKVVEEDK